MEKQACRGKMLDFTLCVFALIKHSTFQLPYIKQVLCAMFYLTTSPCRQMLFTLTSLFIGFESYKSYSFTTVQVSQRRLGRVMQNPTTHTRAHTHAQGCLHIHVQKGNKVSLKSYCKLCVGISLTFYMCWKPVDLLYM